MNQNNNQNNNYKPKQNQFNKYNNKPEFNKNSESKVIEYKNINNRNLSENQPSENKSKVLNSFISAQNTSKIADQSNINTNIAKIKKPYNTEYNPVIKEKKIDNIEPKNIPNNNKNLKKSENKPSDKPTYVSKQAFIGDRKKPKKVYADDYEQERDFKLNIYKKNIYATPYFQEKKRRNTFIGKKPKPKEEESWKKKHKKHSNKQND
jgi:hypothetical protein